MKIQDPTKRRYQLKSDRRCASRVAVVVLTIALFLFVSQFRIDAAPGELDPSFGAGGKVVTAVDGGTIFATAVQLDGKVVAAGFSGSGSSNGNFQGDIAVARYNVDGSLDTSFGNNGIVETSIGAGYEEARAVAIQSDGRIVVAGITNNIIYDESDIALVRYNTDGSLDHSFGNAGIVITNVGYQNDYVSAMVIQPDGRIVVAGSVGVSSDNDENIALVRYNTNGSLDTSFGNGGKVADPEGAFSNDPAYAVAIGSDGKIVTGGYRNSGFGLTRFNTNGSLDTSFGTGGKVATNMALTATAYAIMIQSDGKIVATGNSYSGTYPNFINYSALARYNPDGSLDTSFGSNGKVLTPSGGSSNSPRAAAMQSNGKIVLAGYDWIGDHQVFALSRYTTSGAPDLTFGPGGKVNTQFTSSSSDLAYSVAIQPNGKIIAAGVSFSESGPGFGLVRYQAETLSALISGRVTTPDARGVRNAIVSITDSAGIRLATTTNSLGFYTFENIRVGEIYSIAVSSKRYRFEPRSPLVNESLMNVDFVGLE